MSVSAAAVASTVLASSAAALACPGPPPRPASWSRLVARLRGVSPTGVLLPVLLAGAVLVVTRLDGTRLALAVVVLGTAGAVAVLARRSRAARLAARRRRSVVEVCEALVGELRAGIPSLSALEHCRDVWPEIEPVAGAARLGASVPAALRRIAEKSGAEGLREVAAAWQVSDRSGAGLAGALGQVADTARAREATRHVVRGELASAQATARLVALLPLASLAMSAGIGGHPWHFLLATTPGVACLGASILLAFAGLAWIDRIAAAVLRA